MLPITRARQPATLVEQFETVCQQQPDLPAVTLLAGDSAHTLSRAEFYAAARRAMHRLMEISVKRGDVAVLVQGHGAPLLTSFWGALLLGAVPSIFPFLSEKLDPARYFESVRAMVEHAEARVIIAEEKFIPDLRPHLADRVAMLGAETLAQSPSTPEPPTAAPQPDDIAFLQHSSGSTGIQKGVMLSHRAVLHQIASYSESINLRDDDVIVSWLPLYHDMGLIAAFILPIMQGIPLVLLSPFEWVRDPKRLLYAIQQYRGTLCWLPNFAYNFMALQVRERDFDLSSMRAFINCSEPVYHSSHEAFFAAFESCGVRREALATCYAMAENTFAVTQSKIGVIPAVDMIDSTQFLSAHRAVPADMGLTKVSCGQPIQGCAIRIVDEARQPLPERSIGEVALRSDSMLSGYHNRPDATAAALVDGWFYTGDLGYIADGELYITGRKKDLIIVGGKNIYPQDIEYLVSEVPGVHPGRVVVFGVFNERLATEDIAITAEIDDDDAPRIEREIRARIAQNIEATARYVHLVKAGWLIKTSSGKVARSANRDKFIAEVLR